MEARDEDGEPMTAQELRDEMMTMLLAGHETTATALAWVLRRLCRHPDVRARAQAEVDRVTRGDAIDAGRVRELEYLDAVIKESLRLHPIIAMVGRHLQRPMRVGGWDLPRGTMVAPCIWLTQRRSETWPDPERFDPTRFLDRRMGPYEFFPFGGGIRRCIGMAFAYYEMKIVLATILRRFDVQPAPGTRIRIVRRSITFAPSGGMPLVFEPRAGTAPG